MELKSDLQPQVLPLGSLNRLLPQESEGISYVPSIRHLHPFTHAVVCWGRLLHARASRLCTSLPHSEFSDVMLVARSQPRRFCLFVCLFLINLNFWSVFREEDRDIYYFSSTSPHMPRLPHYQYPPPEWSICSSWWTCIDTSLSPKVGFTLGVGFDKRKMMYNHHYRIRGTNFTVKPYKSPVPPLLPLTLGNLWSFHYLYSFAFSGISVV